MEQIARLKQMLWTNMLTIMEQKISNGFDNLGVTSRVLVVVVACEDVWRTQLELEVKWR